MTTKFCRKCKQWKPLDEFYQNSRGGCRKCIQAGHKAWRLKKYPPQAKPKLPDGLRRCSQCQQIKTIEEFYRDKSEASGYAHRCKVCSDAGRRIRRQKEQEAKLSLREQLPEGFKKCNKCGLVQPVSEFRKTPKGTYTSPCKTCIKQYREQTRDRTKEQGKLYRSNPEVRERTNERRRRWREKPESQAKEKIYRQAYQKRGYVAQKNREHNLEYRIRPENQEKARAKTIEWRRSNPEQARLQGNIKRARKRQAEGSHTVEQWEQLLSFFEVCPQCGGPGPFTRDHIIPLVHGGTDYIDNIQPLCSNCNTRKNAHLIIDYRPREVRIWAFLQVTEVSDIY